MNHLLSLPRIVTAAAILTLLSARVSTAESTATVSNPHPHRAYSRVEDVAVEKGGAVYVLDNGLDEVLKLSPDGALLWRVSLQIRDGLDSNSYKLALNKAHDMVYVVSNAADFREVTADGKLQVLSSALGGYTDRIMAIDAAGKVYFPNRQNNQIEVYVIPPFSPEDYRSDLGGIFTNKTTFTPFIDGNVSGPSHLGRPHRVEVSPSGSRVWVLCQDYAFRLFDQDGKFIALVKAPDKQNQSFTSVDTEFAADGTTYIRSFQGHCVLVYSANGELLRLVPLGRLAGGAFGMDADDNFYLGKPVESRDRTKPQPDWAIDVLSQDGRLLRTIMGPPGQLEKQSAEQRQRSAAPDVPEAPKDAMPRGRTIPG